MPTSFSGRPLSSLAALALALLVLLAVPTVTDLGLVAAHGDEAPITTGAPEDPDAPAGDHAAASPVSVIGRWVSYLGLFGAFAVPLLHRVVLRSGGPPRRLTRALGAALVASGAAAAAMAVLGDADGRDVLLMRAAVAGVGGAVVLLIRPRLAAAVAVPIGAAGIVLLVAAGHASAGGGPAVFVGQLVHVLGAAVWVSGVALLVALSRWPDRLLDAPPPAFRTVVPRLSAVALLSVGLVVLTGVQTAVAQANAIELRSEYGHTLLMKGGFAAGALALGALNYLDGGRMKRWIDDLRNRVTVELMLIATVLVMSAALAGTPTTPAAATGTISGVASPIGAVLIVGAGMAAAVLGMLGVRLPRCEAVASRVALVGAGVAIVALGGAMLATNAPG